MIPINSIYKKLFVTAITQETSDVKTYTLKSEVPITYAPGQFLTFVFVRSGIEERRSYSISSAPVLNEPLAVTVKRIPNGEYSRKLIDTLKVGDELITIGASGFFTLPADLSEIKQFVFLAAGSGITPVISLIKTILHVYPDKKVLLIYSNRTQADTIFFSTLQRLAADHADRFEIEFLFSSSHDLAHARLSNFWLEKILVKRGVKELDTTLFYMCGPFDYMLMVNITLLSYGVPATNIKKEHFSNFKVPPKEEPPDRDLHTVTLIIGKTRHQFETRYPVSILQKAKQAGLDLPFSCEAGRCGTCVARCLEGRVWMSNNEVLLDEELEKGLILTCTGYAAGGDVVIEI